MIHLAFFVRKLACTITGSCIYYGRRHNFRVTGFTSLVQKEVDDIAKNGPSPFELENAQRYFNKLYKTGISSNSYWTETLTDYYQYGIDNFTNYEKMMNALTPSDIRKFAKTVFGQKNKMEFVLLPKK